MIEFDDALLFVTAAGEGSCLCVLSDAEADIGQVAYEMTLMVNRVGEHLAVEARQPGGSPF
jgi:predicted regulator of Ras-like GTPase activity (Roadblock/LC7/MglB family)